MAMRCTVPRSSTRGGTPEKSKRSLMPFTSAPHPPCRAVNEIGEQLVTTALPTEAAALAIAASRAESRSSEGRLSHTQSAVIPCVVDEDPATGRHDSAHVQALLAVADREGT